jgi:hypothetical protein
MTSTRRCGRRTANVCTNLFVERPWVEVPDPHPGDAAVREVARPDPLSLGAAAEVHEICGIEMVVKGEI